MIRRPPRSTRTDTLFPYTTLFRSATASGDGVSIARQLGADKVIDYRSSDFTKSVSDADVVLDTIGGDTQHQSYNVLRPGRSEERRVGKECVSTCRSRWSPDN